MPAGSQQQHPLQSVHEARAGSGWHAALQSAPLAPPVPLLEPPVELVMPAAPPVPVGPGELSLPQPTRPEPTRPAVEEAPVTTKT